MDDQVRVRMSDSEVREYLRQLGITNSSLLQQMEKENRDETLVKLKTVEWGNNKSVIKNNRNIQKCDPAKRDGEQVR